MRTEHVHVVPYGWDKWNNYIHFRDALRSDPDLAAEYAKLKNDLQIVYVNDREGYTAGKADFISSVVESFEPIKVLQKNRHLSKRRQSSLHFSNTEISIHLTQRHEGAKK